MGLRSESQVRDNRHNIPIALLVEGRLPVAPIGRSKGGACGIG